MRAMTVVPGRKGTAAVYTLDDVTEKRKTERKLVQEASPPRLGSYTGSTPSRSTAPPPSSRIARGRDGRSKQRPSSLGADGRAAIGLVSGSHRGPMDADDWRSRRDHRRGTLRPQFT